MAHRASKDLKVNKVHKASKDRRGFPERRVIRGHLVHKVSKDCRVNRDL